MTIQNQQSNNFFQQIPKKIGYDLEEEKKIIAEATEEIKKDLWGKWKRTYDDAEIFPSAVSRLNPSIRDVLLSFENTVLYDSLMEKFKLNTNQRDFLPQIIWDSALKNNFGELEKNLQGKLMLNPESSHQIFNELNQKIISKISSARNISPVNQKQKNAVQMQLEEAIKKYSEIGDEMITSGMIKIPTSENPVRPSIKNWLTDYFFNLGNEKHDAMQRSAYLFQSQNGKNLLPNDRQKLSFLLKTVDEKSLVEIDADSKKIIFPKLESLPSNSQVSKPNFPSNSIPKFTPKPEVPKASSQPEKKASPFPNNISKDQNHVTNNPSFDAQHNIQKATFSSPQKMIQEKPIASSPNIPAKPFSVQPKKELPKMQEVPKPVPNQATQPVQKNPNFSEELKKIKEKLNHQKPSQKTVNVINLKDLV